MVAKAASSGVTQFKRDFSLGNGNSVFFEYGDSHRIQVRVVRRDETSEAVSLRSVRNRYGLSINQLRRFVVSVVDDMLDSLRISSDTFDIQSWQAAIGALSICAADRPELLGEVLEVTSTLTQRDRELLFA